MKAIILAAGFGTRLKPLTNKVPKALLPVSGVPLIYYPLQTARAAGITDIVINLHHLGEQIEKKLGDGRNWGLKISYSWEKTILGTGGGIRKSSELCNSSPLLVINSDILIDISLKEVIRFHKARGGIATMVVRHRPPESRHTPIEMEGDRVLKITRGESTNRNRQAYYFTGVQIIESQLIDLLPEGPSCIIEGGYQRALSAGKSVHGMIHGGYWNDLGTPDSFQTAEQDLTAGRVELSHLDQASLEQASLE